MVEFDNYIIIVVPFLVALFTQTFKFILYCRKHGMQWEYFLTHGHMPSAHTAFVISALTTIGYFEGIDSASFALASIFALIIIDDALRIRMYLGDQGRYLNMLIEQLAIDKNKFPRLKERVGHRTNEVIVGALIGIFLSLALIKLLEFL